MCTVLQLAAVGFSACTFVCVSFAFVSFSFPLMEIIYVHAISSNRFSSQGIGATSEEYWISIKPT